MRNMQKHQTLFCKSNQRFYCSLPNLVFYSSETRRDIRKKAIDDIDSYLARQADRQTDKQTDKQKDRQTDRQIYRQIDALIFLYLKHLPICVIPPLSLSLLNKGYDDPTMTLQGQGRLYEWFPCGTMHHVNTHTSTQKSLTLFLHPSCPSLPDWHRPV